MEKQDNTLAWVSYLTIIGWIIALIMYNDSQKGNTIVRFHIKQSLGLWIVAFLFWVVLIILAIIPILGWVVAVIITPIFYIGLLVLWIMGLIYAAQGEEKHIPLIGKFFDEKITFIS